MQKKKLTEKMLIEIVDNMPKPLADYLIEKSTKPIDNLKIYTKGFCEGMTFVIETIVKPHIERMDKISNS